MDIQKIGAAVKKAVSSLDNKKVQTTISQVVENGAKKLELGSKCSSSYGKALCNIQNPKIYAFKTVDGTMTLDQASKTINKILEEHGIFKHVAIKAKGNVVDNSYVSGIVNKILAESR